MKLSESTRMRITGEISALDQYRETRNK